MILGLLCAAFLILKLTSGLGSDVKPVDNEPKVNSEAQLDAVYSPLDPELTSADSYTVFVDKKHPLPSTYVPSDLYEPYIPSTSEVLSMRQEVGVKAQEMIKAAKEAEISLYLMAAYRSYDDQQDYYRSRADLLGEKAVASLVDKPGHSEHQTGLALDFTDDPSGTESMSFADTEAFAWLCENAHNYGFILRYPEGKEKYTGYSFRPWHFRYVGTITANSIYAMGKDATFEEFFGIVR